MDSVFQWRIAVDTGGTFTDCEATDPMGEVRRCKVLSTSALRVRIERLSGDGGWVIGNPWQVPAGLFDGYWVRLCGQGGESRIERQTCQAGACVIYLAASETEDWQVGAALEIVSDEEAPVFAMRLVTATPRAVPLPPHELRLATTRGTNALLEAKGEPPLLVVSAGFGDVLEIGDQRRPDLFALRIDKPPPLTHSVVEIPLRLTADGAVDGTWGEAEQAALEAVVSASGARTAAVSLLHGYHAPPVEAEVVQCVAAAGIDYVASGAALSPFIKYVERTQTAVVDAYLGPVMSRYLDRVAAAMGAAGRLLIMTSSGGLLGRAQFRPKDALLSGPAGGVAGVAAAGRRADRYRLLGFDMGGTSTDVSRYDAGFDMVEAHTVGSARLFAPALRIETVAAGGGSVCDFDGRQLVVGPHSAGAVPGPACYGAGGPLTVTDVNLLLGRLDPARFGVPMFVEAAHAALDVVCGAVAAARGGAVDRQTVLEDFLELANERMAGAIRRISVREGFDPAEYCLVAFGGAGGQHACAIADKLEIGEILIPAEAGLLSAFGLRHAPRSAQLTRQVLEDWASCAPHIDAWMTSLEVQARAALEADGQLADPELQVERSVGLRLRGQEQALVVPVEPGNSPVAAFAERYQRMFGYYPATASLELVYLRCAVHTQPPTLASETFERVPDDAVDRMRVLPDAFSTRVVMPGWQVFAAPTGSLLLRRVQGPDVQLTAAEGQPGSGPRPIIPELTTERLRHIVDEMGLQLRRTALSTNVKERADYSCALLDPAGRLVMNAPHIPVHLGALGVCVRRVCATLPMTDGDVIIVNHPAFGGSHLPDITLVAPVYAAEEVGGEPCLVGYLANRAHHAEIGGKRPGSMPPDATCLAEEGVVIAPTYLFRAGEPRHAEIRALLSSGPYPSRNPAENMADLEAQVAAIRAGSVALQRLAAQYPAGALRAHMDWLYALAGARVAMPLRQRVGTGVSSVQYLDDGTRLAVTLRPDGERVCIDFSGTGPVHGGNLNATPGIVRSVVVYVLRLLAGGDDNLPLNEGLLDCIDLLIPESLLNPRFGDDPRAAPAVVGGNVEISQRLTDCLIDALGLAAASQGTMNNLIFGNAHISYYETIGGGAGAGPGYHGAHGVHVHMTNTAITDPEILEHRYPVRMLRFAVRRGSGGDGACRGGDGLVRELQFLEPMEVSILSQNRNQGPRGAHGGHPGAVGRNWRIDPTGCATELGGMVAYSAQAGERLRIETPGGGGWGAASFEGCQA
jgi:5-oxoprolinase (ATP-hydrolysing)